HMTSLCNPKPPVKTVAIQHAAQPSVCLTAIQAKLVSEGQEVPVNIYLDTCAEVTVMAMPTAKRLGALPREVPPIWLTGISTGGSRTKGLLAFQVVSIDGTFSRPMYAHITERTTYRRDTTQPIY